MTDEQERVHVVPGKNGVFRPTVVQAGRALGTWTRPKGKATTVEVVVFDEDGLPGPVERARRVRRHGGRCDDVLPAAGHRCEPVSSSDRPGRFSRSRSGSVSSGSTPM